jgi:hypothetical protein
VSTADGEGGAPVNRWNVKFVNLFDAQAAWERAMAAQEDAEAKLAKANVSLKRMTEQWNKAVGSAYRRGYADAMVDRVPTFVTPPPLETE